MTDDDVYISLDSEIFQQLTNITLDWCKVNEIDGISNSDEREAIVKKLEVFVKENHSKLAKDCMIDETIYESVLNFINENDLY